MISIGQIWKDNYDYKTDYVRYVQVRAVDPAYIKVRTCTADGNAVRNRETRVKVGNFTKAYTFFKESA